MVFCKSLEILYTNYKQTKDHHNCCIFSYRYALFEMKVFSMASEFKAFYMHPT